MSQQTQKVGHLSFSFDTGDIQVQFNIGNISPGGLCKYLTYFEKEPRKSLVSQKESPKTQKLSLQNQL